MKMENKNEVCHKHMFDKSENHCDPLYSNCSKINNSSISRSNFQDKIDQPKLVITRSDEMLERSVSDKLDNFSQVPLDDAHNELDSIDVLVTNPHNNIDICKSPLKHLNGNTSKQETLNAKKPFCKDDEKDHRLEKNENDGIVDSELQQEKEKPNTANETSSSVPYLVLESTEIPITGSSMNYIIPSFASQSVELMERPKKSMGCKPVSEKSCSNNILSNSSFSITDNTQVYETTVDLQQGINIELVTDDISRHSNCFSEEVSNHLNNSTEKTCKRKVLSERRSNLKSVYKSLETRNTKARRISAKMKLEWTKEIQSVGHLTCPMQGCSQKYVTITNFMTHYKWCTGKKSLQHCPYCESLIFSTQEAVLHHMEVEHPDRVIDHKEKFPSTVSQHAQNYAQISSKPLIKRRLRRSKIKDIKNRIFSSRQNSIIHKRALNQGLKTIEKTMTDNLKEFKKCVRFNDIVQKINSVTDEPQEKICVNNDVAMEQQTLSLEEKETLFDVDSVHTAAYFTDENESVDCPSYCNELIVKGSGPLTIRRISTKSRILLNTRGYERFKDYVTLSRNWASERRTYSRSRNADNNANVTQEETSLPYDVQDSFQLCDSRQPPGISLSVTDSHSEIIPPAQYMKSSIRKGTEKGKRLQNCRIKKTKTHAKCEIGGNCSISESEHKKEQSLFSKCASANGTQNTQALTEEVNYGYFVFSKPSKKQMRNMNISDTQGERGRTRITCYDNVVEGNADTTASYFISQNFDKSSRFFPEKMDRSEFSSQPQFGRPSQVVIDFDKLLDSYPLQCSEQTNKKPNSLPETIHRPNFVTRQHSTNEKSKINSNTQTKVTKSMYRKQDGVKLPQKMAKKESQKQFINKLEIKSNLLTDDVEQKNPSSEREKKMNVKCRSYKDAEINSEVGLIPVSNHKKSQGSAKAFSMESFISNSCNLPPLKKLVITFIKKNLFAKGEKLLNCPEIIKCDYSCHHFLDRIICTQKGGDAINFEFCAHNPYNHPTYKHLQGDIISLSHLLVKKNSTPCVDSLGLFSKENEKYSACRSYIYPVLKMNLIKHLFDEIFQLFFLQKHSLSKEYKNVIERKYVFGSVDTHDENVYKTFISSPYIPSIGESFCTPQLLEFKEIILGLISTNLGCYNAELIPALSMNKKGKRGRPSKKFLELKNAVFGEGESSYKKHIIPSFSCNDVEKNIEENTFCTASLKRDNNAHTDTLTKKRGRKRKLIPNVNDLSDKITNIFISKSDVLNENVPNISEHDSLNAINEKRKRPEETLPNTLDKQILVSIPKNMEVSILKRKRGRPPKLTKILEIETYPPSKKLLDDKLIKSCAHTKDHICNANDKNAPCIISFNNISEDSIHPIDTTKDDMLFLSARNEKERERDMCVCEENVSNFSKNIEKLSDKETIDVIAVRKSSRLKKKKLMYMSVTTDESTPQSLTRNVPTIPCHREVQFSIEKRKKGRPKKNLDVTKEYSPQHDTSNPPSMCESETCISPLSNGLTSDMNSQMEVNRRCSRKGWPRKCVRYAGSNSDILKCINKRKSSFTAKNQKIANGKQAESSSKSVSLSDQDKEHLLTCQSEKVELIADCHLEESLPDSKIANKGHSRSGNYIYKITSFLEERSFTSKLMRKLLNKAMKLQRNILKNRAKKVNKARNITSLKRKRAAAIRAEKLVGEWCNTSKDEPSLKMAIKDEDFTSNDCIEKSKKMAKGTENELMKVKLFYSVPTPVSEKRTASETLIDFWTKELRTKGKIICDAEHCSKELGTKRGMIFHYEHACEKVLDRWICKMCNKTVEPCNVKMLNHFKRSHSKLLNDETTRTCTMKLEETRHLETVTSSLSFENETRVCVMLPEIKVEKKLWLKVENSFVRDLLLKPSINLKIRKMVSHGEIEKDESSASHSWFSLQPFESYPMNVLEDTNSSTFFAAGSVCCASWCPTPLLTTKCNQYLMIATSCEKKFSNACLTDERKSILQLWDMGDLEDVVLRSRPSLKIAVVLKFKKIMEISWAPGCWESPQTPNDLEFLPRLGVVAVASTDSCVQLFSIPHPESLNCPPDCLPFYDVEPILLLKHDYIFHRLHDSCIKCTCISWEKMDRCGLVACGYSNGFICGWQVSNFSTLQSTFMQEENTVLPHFIFQAHSAAVSFLEFSPLSGSRYIATGSIDKYIKVWDMYEPGMPILKLKRGFSKGALWTEISSGLFLGFDEGLISKSIACFQDLSTSKKYRAIATHIQHFCSQSFSISPKLNIAAFGDFTGELSITQINVDSCKPTSTVPQCPIYKTDVRLLRTDTDLESNNHPDNTCGKNYMKTRLPFAKNDMQTNSDDIFISHGLIFEDLMNPSKNMAVENEVRGKKNVQSVEMDFSALMRECYPASINSISWNPNKGTHHWLFTANELGIGRIICTNYDSKCS